VSGECDARVGPWNERYFLYSEEVDYCARVRDAGFRVHYVPDASVVHEEGGSGRSCDTGALMAVNRVQYFASRHDPRAVHVFRALAVLHGLLRATQPVQRAAIVALLSSARARSLPIRLAVGA
jgi:GT2 family glycosyltransferase